MTDVCTAKLESSPGSFANESLIGSKIFHFPSFFVFTNDKISDEKYSHSRTDIIDKERQVFLFARNLQSSNG